MKAIKKYLLLFVIGAIGYASIEIIFRGYTHWSMMLAGGICLDLFSVIARFLSKKRSFIKAAACGACVTGVEFLFGVVFNLWLGMGIWDYSHIPFNILGQICPLFTIVWIVLAAIFLPLVKVINLEYA